MRIGRTVLLALTLAVAASTITGQGLPKAKPEEVGLSSERLRRINQLFQGYVDQSKLAGLITLVARDGKLVHFERYGYSDLASQKVMGRDAIFRIHSMTKPITGVALMTLYEEGKFQLTDPVSQYIPEFKDLKVAVGQEDKGIVLERADHELTIGELMTHTSGLTYGSSQSEVDILYRKAEVLSRKGTLADMIQKLSKIPLRQQPGTQWHYSVSVDVQGYLIEVLSGQELDEFFRKQIFEPLKMLDTGFYVPEEKHHRFTSSYGPAQEGEEGIRVVDHPSNSVFSKPTTFFSGGGGLVSTASDYLRFCQMLLNGGELDGVRILGPKTVGLMAANHLPKSIGEIRPNSGIGFGLDFAVMLDPVAAGSPGSVGEYYWGGAASTLFWVDPKEKLIAILMTQFRPSRQYPLRQQLRTLVYQAIVN